MSPPECNETMCDSDPSVLSGSGCGLFGHRAHPSQQGAQDEEAHVPRPRPHQPVHELAVPHRDDPDREGADRPQTRGGSGPEEKGAVQQTLHTVLHMRLR